MKGRLLVEPTSRGGPPGVSKRITGHVSVAEVVSEEFSGLTPIKRHKMVYACVNDEIASGMLHALTIIAKTPDELNS